MIVTDASSLVMALGDACYVAVAELFRTPLVTGDAKMAGGTGARCRFEVFPE